MLFLWAEESDSRKQYKVIAFLFTTLHGEHESWSFYSFNTERFHCWRFAGAALVIMVTVRQAISLQAPGGLVQVMVLITGYDLKVFLYSNDERKHTDIGTVEMVKSGVRFSR